MGTGRELDGFVSRESGGADSEIEFPSFLPSISVFISVHQRSPSAPTHGSGARVDLQSRDPNGPGDFAATLTGM